MSEDYSLHERSILLFDGSCYMCQFWVQFIMQHEREETYFFAPIDSTIGRELYQRYQISDEVDSVIVVKNNQVYLYSDAVIQVLKELQWYVRLLTIVKYLPVTWRDGCYQWVAKHRYRLFTRRETCRIPTPTERKRFID